MDDRDRMRAVGSAAAVACAILLVCITLPSAAAQSSTGVQQVVYYQHNDTYGWNGTCPVITVPATTPLPASGSGSQSLQSQFGDGVAAWVGFLFIVIASSQCALIVRVVGLPLITGYMFFGAIVGPQAIGMVTKTDISYLSPITQTALAFISLSAGAELYLPELRALFRRIIAITSAVTVVCFIVCLFTIYFLAAVGLVPFMSALSGSCQFSISLIAASIMVTQSPASAIAVVAETKSKGPFTSTMLGITVLTDIVVLLLYSICAAVANANCAADASGFKILDLIITISCILMAGFLGYLFGKLIIFLIWVPRLHGEWFVLPLGFAVFKISAWFTDYSTTAWGHGINFDPLLICIFAGYVVANHSRNRRKFLRYMARLSPVVFIPFFTLTGAALNLKVIVQSIGFALIIFATRAATFLGGTYIGGKYTGMETKQQKTLWISMLTQAGVSLGIAAEVAIAFPAWGTDFQSTMVSVILINQIVGPILCKWALKHNGEVGQAMGDEEEEDEEHIKRCVIVGINISSLAVAQRLLKQDWNVLFIDSDIRKTDMLQWLQYERRKKKEKTAAQLARRAAILKAKSERAAGMVPASTFKDLAPPPEGGEGESTSVNMPEGDAPKPEFSDLPAEPSRVESTYSAVQGDEPNPFEESPPATAELISPEGVRGEDLNNTTTPPEEQQVQFRLLTPLDVNKQTDAALARLAFAREAAGFKKIIWDLNAHNVNAAVVMMELDELNFDLCSILQDTLHLSRVIVEIQNPNWTSMFASVGILTVFPYSLSSHTIFTMVTAGPRSELELVSPMRPLHVGLSHIIKPDTLIENPPLYLRHLSPEDQMKFLEQHPDPPMPRELMWKFDEKLHVVSAAQRDEYVSNLHNLHGNNSIELDHSTSLGAAASAFAGPGLLAHTGGHDDGDADDPDEQKFQQLRRQESARRKAEKEQARVRKASMQMDDEL